MADSGNIWASTIPSTGAAVYTAPLGTPLPTSATSSLNVAFKDLGWVSEDGVVNSITRDTTKHYAWGGDCVKTTQDRYSETVRLTLLETSPDVLRLVYGQDAVTASGNPSGTILAAEHSSLMLTRRSFVIDFVDGAREGRHVIREGLVITVGDVSYVHTDLTRYEIEIDCYRPEDSNLAAVVTYFDYTPGS